MALEIICNQSFEKARTTNQTSASFVAKVPTTTEPTGSGSTATNASVRQLGQLNGRAYTSSVIVCPYGVGSDTNTFSVRVIGWRRVGNADSGTVLWIPVLLAEIEATISTGAGCTGVAGADVVATEYFADTITVTYGNANVSVEVVSPAADIPAHAVVSTKGFQKIELSFSTGSSATSCNALIALM